MSNIYEIGLMCTGCRACEQSCPFSAIRMKPNTEGFLFPTIEKGLCTNCGHCLNVCSANKICVSYPVKAFGLKNPNREEVINSASGGAAFAFGKYMIGNGGKVYGAAYDENLHVKHTCVKSVHELNKTQSSKYVQSDTCGVYSEIKNDLDAGNKVLFVGTPCQVAGLNGYLNCTYANLITVDLVCHGVPSPSLFKLFIKCLEKEARSKLLKFDFRYKKKRGWGMYYYYYCANGKTGTGPLSFTKYGWDFLKGINYRECCYKCKYANINSRPADITIGDYWRLMAINPSFYSNDGVSAVIINTDKGDRFFESIKSELNTFECRAEDIVKGQGNLVEPTNRPVSRDTYYSKIDDAYFEGKNTNITIVERLRHSMPQKLIVLLKRIKGIFIC